jgi:nicotinate-nucleotide adenylyltransferase
MSGDFMNIVYGGAFNPPTIAHQYIIKTLLNKFDDANIIVLPVGNDYDKKHLLEFNHRFEMLKLMTKPFKNRVIVSDLEEKQGFKGTIAALNQLSKTYDQLYFVIGSDHLESLKTWIDYQELLETYSFIVMNRNHYMTQNQAEELFKDIKHHFVFVEFDMEISSSMIRSDIHKHKKFLTNDVYKYIKKHELYEGK